GQVWKVIDAETGEPRALKLVPASGTAMLLDEFEQLARLRHPSLPRVFEVGRSHEPIDDLPAGSPFFLAEWIAGGRCDARAWTGDDLAARIWALLCDVAGALATIHAAGLVHGDVAPQNILIADDGRAVLVDLGLGAAFGGAAGPGAASSALGVRGTPAYMAPEAVAGDLEPRSDLYGLAASVVRVVTGRSPFAPAGSPEPTDAAGLGDLFQRIVSGGPPPELSALPRPLADLVGRMIARDPDGRPRSALAVLDELDQLAPAIAPGSARRARPRVGAAPAPVAWPGGAAVIDAIERSLAAGAAVAIVGPAGSGARELADGALRRHQLAQVARGSAPAPASPSGADGERARPIHPLLRIAGSLDEVGAQLVGVDAAAPGGAAADAALDSAGRARSWIERVARAARRGAAPVVIELAGDPRADDLIGALARADGDGPVIAIVDAAPAGEPRPRLAVHAAPVLDDDGVAALASAMLGAAPPRPWVRALRVASGGLPVLVMELVRSIAGEPQPFAVDWTARTTAGIAELHARQLRAASAPARRVAAAIAAWGGRVRIDRALATLRADGKLPATLADVAELERAGLAHRRGDAIAIDRATADAAEAVAGGEAIARLATTALVMVSETRFEDAARPDRGAALQLVAPLLERAVLDAARAALACDAAEHLLARGRADRALGLARRAIAIAPGPAGGAGRAGLIAARAAAAAGSYRDAAAYARDAEAAGADPVAARLVAARAAQRAGELDAAEAALAALHAAEPRHREVAGSYARLLVTRSRYREARAVAAAAGPLSGLCAEAAGLAAFYLGELEAADAAFAALEVGAAASGDDATAGRASSLRGMVAQQRGQLGLASDRYREAVRRLAEVGEVHAAATAELNLGTALVERGRASDALPRLAAAGRVFAELGATTEWCAAELNRGNALLLVGQVEDARAAADAAVARSAGAPHLR
ncbi:MAG TPA: serine/threonine-protein kinase, partial [Kofleriaceae bacterium]|nr:serine/threonine-protein kinase [Kofleriaceae bacterium]